MAAPLSLFPSLSLPSLFSWGRPCRLRRDAKAIARAASGRRVRLLEDDGDDAGPTAPSTGEGGEGESSTPLAGGISRRQARRRRGALALAAGELPPAAAIIEALFGVPEASVTAEGCGVDGEGCAAAVVDSWRTMAAPSELEPHFAFPSPFASPSFLSGVGVAMTPFPRFSAEEREALSGLSAQQRAAVATLLFSAQPVVLLQGPPGTGKTGVVRETRRFAPLPSTHSLHRTFPAPSRHNSPCHPVSTQTPNPEPLSRPRHASRRSLPSSPSPRAAACACWRPPPPTPPWTRWWSGSRPRGSAWCASATPRACRRRRCGTRWTCTWTRRWPSGPHKRRCGDAAPPPPTVWGMMHFYTFLSCFSRDLLFRLQSRHHAPALCAWAFPSPNSQHALSSLSPPPPSISGAHAHPMSRTFASSF